MQKKVIYDKNTDSFIFECPHCDQLILVLKNEINCCIFRHSITKDFEQINSHLSEELCNQLLKNESIFGCSKPFKFVNGEFPYVEACDYM